jgi:1,4-alpha-glucan branching enzyme
MARLATKDSTKIVDFKYSAPNANRVFIAGTFNNWSPSANPLKKDWTGMWKTSLKLSAGKYEYKYIVDGNWQNDPLCQSCVPNNLGSTNCIKIVR